MDAGKYSSCLATHPVQIGLLLHCQISIRITVQEAEVRSRVSETTYECTDSRPQVSREPGFLLPFAPVARREMR